MAEAQIGEADIGQTPLIVIAAPGQKIELTVVDQGGPRKVTAELGKTAARLDVPAP